MVISRALAFPAVILAFCKMTLLESFIVEVLPVAAVVDIFTCAVPNVEMPCWEEMHYSPYLLTNEKLQINICEF